MNKPELQEIPGNASIKLVLTITSNNQRALVKYNEAPEKQNKELKEGLQHSGLTFINMLKNNTIVGDKNVKDAKSNIIYLHKLLISKK